jgi:hypothetical protein
VSGMAGSLVIYTPHAFVSMRGCPWCGSQTLLYTSHVFASARVSGVAWQLGIVVCIPQVFVSMRCQGWWLGIVIYTPHTFVSKGVLGVGWQPGVIGISTGKPTGHMMLTCTHTCHYLYLPPTGHMGWVWVLVSWHLCMRGRGSLVPGWR